jgi:hypothetical protein
MAAIVLPSIDPARKEKRSLPAGLPKKPAMKVVVVERWEELEPYVAAWEALAAAALEPNVFYEAWMLRPALEAFGQGRLQVVLVLADLPPGSPHAPLLCGLFPLERRRTYKGFPAGTLALWRYVHCYLCTPLLHAAYARLSLDAFFTWLAQDRRGTPLLSCPWIPGEGPFQRLLAEYLEEKQTPVLVDELFTRAMLVPRDSAKKYLEETVSSERRRRLRRHEERLAEGGNLSYAELDAHGDVSGWLDDFLRLEASGWKGRAGTALGCQDVDRRYFLEIMTEAHRRGRLTMLALRQNGQSVASLCDLRCDQGSYVYKLAFDEAHGQCSPGVLLELERLRWVHDRQAIQWVDSCNAPGPALLKDLWAERRVLQSLLLAPGKAPGALAVALLPLLRWCRRQLRTVTHIFRRR